MGSEVYNSTTNISYDALGVNWYISHGNVPLSTSPIGEQGPVKISMRLFYTGLSCNVSIIHAVYDPTRFNESYVGCSETYIDHQRLILPDDHKVDTPTVITSRYQDIYYKSKRLRGSALGMYKTEIRRIIAPGETYYFYMCISNIKKVSRTARFCAGSFLSVFK